MINCDGILLPIGISQQFKLSCLRQPVNIVHLFAQIKFCSGGKHSDYCLLRYTFLVFTARSICAHLCNVISYLSNILKLCIAGFSQVTCCASVPDCRLLFFGSTTGVLSVYKTEFNPSKVSELITSPAFLCSHPFLCLPFFQHNAWACTPELRFYLSAS